ncbi:hypothetical protein O181_053023 [Austropuccinia psidii MF-1]|uniref:Endonuclease/exonuclease/phosphatase domain-containing protein n=1 Tax=Austropuccinia psidii MF-1 TaxID=1389203 RepID=A0A9Q3HQ05_9BASI|nr:hypothetical protein [Austropuccinia psidii MF-1]
MGGEKKLTLKSLYNPPTTFKGIDILKDSLNNNNPRHNPTIIAMDSNLHSKLWNPRGYNQKKALKFAHPREPQLLYNQQTLQQQLICFGPNP